jgi:hypothetical protein
LGGNENSTSVEEDLALEQEYEGLLSAEDESQLRPIKHVLETSEPTQQAPRQLGARGTEEEFVLEA